MNVEELIAMLERVTKKTALVFAKDSSDSGNIIHHAVIEHDLQDDEVVVVLKTEG